MRNAEKMKVLLKDDFRMFTKVLNDFSFLRLCYSVKLQSAIVTKNVSLMCFVFAATAD